MLIVGKDVEIEGDIIVNIVIVCGWIKGSLCVRKVEFLGLCYVEGDILYIDFMVELGVFFEGGCCYVEDLFVK